MDCDTLPVLQTRNVLLNHVKAKIQSLKSITLTNECLEEISCGLSNKDLLNLLENEKELIAAVGKCNSIQALEKQALGEDLFVAVSELDSELCAQLTGMLLELDVETIKNLIEDKNCLKQAVSKAKQEYIKYTHGNLKYTLGEELFELVLERYSDQQLAGRLTGMLLELDTDTLSRLICTPSELDDKLGTAYSVLLNLKDKN